MQAMDSPASRPQPVAAAELDDAPARATDGRPEPKPRARSRRRPVTLKGHVLRGTGEIADIELHDLSYNGCKVATPVYLFQGEAIRLSVPRRGVIAAEVRWCADGFAGLVFEPESEPVRPHKLRAETRFEAKGEVVLRRLGFPGFRVDVHDISRVGCRMDLVERPLEGELVSIKFDGLETLEARIAWVEGFTAGAKFDRAIHPAVFDLLKQRLEAP
jgi:hypothetical protein